jgi:hypothetical protein
MASVADGNDTERKTDDALKRFRDEVERLRAEHRAAIRSIREGIEKRKLEEIRKQIRRRTP